MRRTVSSWGWDIPLPWDSLLARCRVWQRHLGLACLGAFLTHSRSNPLGAVMNRHQLLRTLPAVVLRGAITPEQLSTFFIE